MMLESNFKIVPSSAPSETPIEEQKEDSQISYTKQAKTRRSIAQRLLGAQSAYKAVGKEKFPLRSDILNPKGRAVERDLPHSPTTQLKVFERGQKIDPQITRLQGEHHKSGYGELLTAHRHAADVYTSPLQQIQYQCSDHATAPLVHYLASDGKYYPSSPSKQASEAPSSGTLANSTIIQSTSGYMNSSVSCTPKFRWWIPGEGIRRDVIEANIQRYLGQDALVKPGVGKLENQVGSLLGEF
jgi:hypothetical protein